MEEKDAKNRVFRTCLISFKVFGYHLLHFLAQVKGFEYLDSVAMREERTQKIGCGAKRITCKFLC